jgi:hypothetical protein
MTKMKNADNLSTKKPKLRIGESERVNKKSSPNKIEAENIIPNTDAREALEKDV